MKEEITPNYAAMSERQKAFLAADVFEDFSNHGNISSDAERTLYKMAADIIRRLGAYAPNGNQPELRVVK